MKITIEKKAQLLEVQKAIKLNNANLKAAKVNAVMCEVNIDTYQKRILKLEELHKAKINRVHKQINRYIDNLKTMNETLDDLLNEKEGLHLMLKDTTHFGEEQCEWCLNYFKPSGLARHKAACGSKPVNKAVKKHKKEIKEVADDNAIRQAALEKELAALKKAKKKPKPVKVVKPKPEPEPEPEPEPKQTLKEVIEEFESEPEIPEELIDSEDEE